MEIYFLLLLFLLMVAALSSGFPVAFALPGSAILTIAIAALCGYLFVGDTDAFFTHGGPNQWLSAGVTNFRSLYWVVERDTLIAIPLFVFMGIMLQRSRVAEDLLVAMARLFGPVPGGLGISVVFVGALLAATTGIVGATVIAMGLISLPAMLHNNYSKPLACGTICASGTLGQIIPPSIVLIILADQLSSAADQANTMRKAEYREITGEYSMPADFDVVSASAGDMFMGAFIPGLILVGLYMVYIFVTALIDPKKAPPVEHEGAFDRQFVYQSLLALLPPLILIFIVLGSIILGVATVNQAGAIGAIGALLMGSYRLTQGQRFSFYPALIAITAVLLLALLLHNFDLNIKNVKTDHDQLGIYLATVMVLLLLFAVGWAIWRAYKINNILNEVMLDTAKTTTMVFIILLGAAMLTSAFRAFGGEELVKDFLTGLPGGFWMQFVVVMLVIFLLGFFLDFIEISVVVVPIVAPILLMDPSANVTAVWLGVMVGMNIQTSFLTPPFGFSLFYLRGVAPAIVKTLHIYKGAAAFIALQIVGLIIAGAYPTLINYLPNRTYLTSETAPPPNNPRLQLCLEDMVFSHYQSNKEKIKTALASIKTQDVSYFPETYRQQFSDSLQGMEQVFERVALVKSARSELDSFVPGYEPVHRQTRQIEASIRDLQGEIKDLEQAIQRNRYSGQPDTDKVDKLNARIDALKQEQSQLDKQIPEQWDSLRQQYLTLSNQEKRARYAYRNHVDDSYRGIQQMLLMMESVDALQKLLPQIEKLSSQMQEQSIEVAMQSIKLMETALSNLVNVHVAKSALSKARRILKKTGDRNEAEVELGQALALLQSEISWRSRARQEALPAFSEFNAVIKNNIGLRLQGRLQEQQAESIAACLARHKDISLAF